MKTYQDFLKKYIQDFILYIKSEEGGMNNESK